MAADLIGRDHPAGVLRAEISRATESHGGLVLVTGEAGIGKTTLVTDAMDVARRAGALVLSGSCWDSSAAPGFWPWVQVVRGLRRHASEAEWAEAEQAAAGQLSFLLGDAGANEPADGFGRYDAVTSALIAVSQRRPVVVVLDDLHWADPSSVRLLEFVAQHTWYERLLLVGTYRDVEVEATDHPLAPLLLSLLAKATTVTLTGLGRDEVGALMTRTVGDAPESELVTEVHLRTGGNPFFVEQTARLWRSGGSVTAVAPGVRDAVRRRLSLLPEAVSRLLTGAAVLGREFHRQVLAASVSAPAAQVDRQLGQAVSARLVSALGDGRFAFAHDLVRETLYESIAEADVPERHAAVVRAMDRSPALTERIFPADLARHAYVGRTELDNGRVVDALVAAGRDARRRFAFEESAGHYRRAVDLLDPDDLRRVKIGLDLGLQLHHFGERDEAWQVFEEVGGIALGGDDVEVLARSALTLYGLSSPTGREKLRENLLRSAHERLVPGEEKRDDRPLDHLAQELILRLIAIARDDGDDDTLGFTLWTQHDALWGPGHAAKRLTLTDELAGIARRNGDHEMEQYAVSLGWVAALEQGDPRYHDRYTEFLSLVDNSPPTNIMIGSYVDRSIIGSFRGNFAEAERQLERAREMQKEHDFFDYMDHHLAWAALQLQGRFADLDKLRAAEVKYPYPALIDGITAASRGDARTATRCLVELESLREPLSNTYRPMLMRLRAQVAALTGEVARCEAVWAELTPFAGTWLVSMYGCDISGPVVLWLARVAAALGWWQEAIEHFTAARDAADLLGARPWSVEARAGLAAALAASGSPSDVLAREVAREAAELGLRHLTSSTVDSLPRNEFRFTGETWTLSMDGRTVHLPDSKGLRDLHVLLKAPGNEVRAVRLLDPTGSAVVGMAGDNLLDDKAKAAYRHRLSELDSAIDEASLRGDDVAKYDRERAALLTELRSASGLGGRTRRLGDEAERARKTVTARIRDTLRKLDARHPELAAHLRAAVATGTTCSYSPEQRVSWHL